MRTATKFCIVLIAIAAIILAWIYLAPIVAVFLFGLEPVVASGGSQQIVNTIVSKIEAVSDGTKEAVIIAFQPTLGNGEYLVFVSKFGEGRESKLIITIAQVHQREKIIAAASLDLTETPRLLLNGEETEKLEINPSKECLAVRRDINLIVEKTSC